jgi:WD40 repeat protein
MGHTNRVFCVKYSQENPNLIVSGGWDLSVKIWDLREPTPIKQMMGPYICGDTIDINGGYLVTGAF